MKLRKTTNELTVEELLKALEDSSFDSTPTTNSLSNSLPIIENSDVISDSYPVASFVDAFNIKPGSKKVGHIILYTLFGLWNKGHGLSVSEFVKQLNRILPYETNTKNKKVRYYYKVSDNVVSYVKYIDHYRKDNKRNYRTNKNYKKYYEKFFADIGITSGPLFVEADVLYHIYDTYMYNRNRKSYSYNNFYLVCSLLFETKYFNDFTMPWFGVSENVKQHISVEAVSNWRKGRKLRGLKSKAAKQKNASKIIYPEAKED